MIMQATAIKFTIAALSLVAGVSFFIWENNIVIPQHAARTLESHNTFFTKQTTIFKAKLQDEILSGGWDRFFLINSIPENRLQMLRRKFSEIQNLAVLGKNNNILAQTFQDVQLTTFEDTLKKARKAKEPLSLLTAHGLNFIFPVYSFDGDFLGSVITQYQPARSGSEDTGLFITDTARTHIYVHPPNFLSELSAIELKKHLQNTATGNSGSENTDLEDTGYTIAWQLNKANGFYLGIIYLTGEYYQLFSFYTMLVAIGLFVIIVVSHRPIWEFITQQHQREALESILSEQKQTLQTLQINLDDFRDRAMQYNEPQFSEKDITEEELSSAEQTQYAEGEIYAVDEATSRVESTEDKKEQSAVVIDLKKVKNEFILLNPFHFDKKQIDAATAGRPPEADRLKEKTFTHELQGLISDVSQSEDISHILTAADELEEKYQKMNIDPYTIYLNEVYFDEVTENEVIHLLSLVRNNLDGNSIAICRFDSYLGCYKTEFTENTPENFKNLFYFLKQDSYMFFDKYDVSVIATSETKKKNPFFKKRIPEQMLEGLKTIIALPLHQWHLDAFVVVFYDHINEKALIPDQVQEKVQKYLHEMAPALKFFFLDSSYHGPANQSIEILKELKEITNLAHKPADVIHLRFKKPASLKDFYLGRTSLKNLLSSQERFIFNTPMHFIILLTKTPIDKVLTTISRNLPEFQVERQHFPDDSHNYYMYI